MSQRSEKIIFLNALDCQSLADREVYLDSVCGDDSGFRARILDLISAHEKPVAAVDQPIVGRRESRPFEQRLHPSVQQSGIKGSQVADNHIGMLIGPYRLMEQIGEGGFGLVFVANQQRPIKRQVALKIVKPGMGSKEVIARFEAERQAVALMEHPNIAQIFDAGITDNSRPYFVMELVRGVPINQFFDNYDVNLRERLILFADVCSAVQHAHQKGVIHRDLKPSNVMVTLHDDHPVVKIIDFGVAKAINQSLTDKTIYTRFFSMIGTPLYMSPEQAEMSGLDVDTRSDIYSLGVMLYELITGTTPFDRQRLDAAGYDEFRRILREENPPKPSLRLTTLGSELETVSHPRRTESSRLVGKVRGDLDWIVMKALEKDRQRRYASASALADDVRRFLNAEPIEARPPSRRYRLGEYARRNRAAIITLSLVGAMMMLGTIVSLWQMFSAFAERDLKEQALQEASAARGEIEQFAENISSANRLVASGQTHADAGRWSSAADEYSRAVRLQPSYYLPWIQRAQFYLRLNLFQEAADDYGVALRLAAPTDEPPWWGVNSLFLMSGYIDESAQLSSQNLKRLANINQDDPPNWQTLRDLLLDPLPVAGSDRLKIENPDAVLTAIELADLADQWLGKSFNGRPEGPRRPDNNRSANPPPPRHRDDGRRPPHHPRDGRGRPPPRHQHPPRPPWNRPLPSSQEQRLPREVCIYLTGIAHLRAGRLERAIQRLTAAGQDRQWPSASLVQAPLAIAYQQAGRTEEARIALSKSGKFMEQRILALRLQGPATVQPSGQPRLTVPWFDFVEGLVLHREAARLIKGELPQWNESMEQLHMNSIRLIEKQD